MGLIDKIKETVQDELDFHRQVKKAEKENYRSAKLEEAKIYGRKKAKEEYKEKLATSKKKKKGKPAFLGIDLTPPKPGKDPPPMFAPPKMKGTSFIGKPPKAPPLR